MLHSNIHQCKLPFPVLRMLSRIIHELFYVDLQEEKDYKQRWRKALKHPRGYGMSSDIQNHFKWWIN